ncbi:MAG: hypothetical protein FJX76_22460 [Armatimonadetes bacterium]|nr:hypothetical protein [Armatimonadota bacterium]
MSGPHTRRGSALLLAIFFLIALFFLARAFQVLIPQEMRAALRMATDTQAGLTADAGVQETLAWVESELSNGREIPNETVRYDTVGEWSWIVKVDPDAQSPPNGTNMLRVYTITSVASLRGRKMRQVTAMVAQLSFSRFAWFQDTRPIGFFLTEDSFDGPVHINDTVAIGVARGFFNGPPPA